MTSMNTILLEPGLCIHVIQVGVWFQPDLPALRMPRSSFPQHMHFCCYTPHTHTRHCQPMEWANILHGGFSLFFFCLFF